MSEILVDLPFDVDERTEERLSAVAEEAVMREAKRQKLLDRMNRTLEDSDMTEKEAIELGREVDRDVVQRLEEKQLL
ncbi:MAG: hypothetical protein SVS85_02595 [Candidatus Nanohaloarchaea archaeon]|nr:hypothetical protein [Candidatus Nanohaloarchaea archaeon]